MLLGRDDEGVVVVVLDVGGGVNICYSNEGEQDTVYTLKKDTDIQMRKRIQGSVLETSKKNW